MTNTQMAILHWLANGETGMSSETMAFWLGFGIRKNSPRHPHDAGDFGRCLGLLSAAPALRDTITDMAVLSQHWESLVMHWADIERQYDAADSYHSSMRVNRLIEDILKGSA